MNKNLYKTIFSKTRGEMIVVAENVSAEGQQNNPSTGRVKIGTEITSIKSLGLSVLSFSLMLVTGAAMFSTSIDANVVADQNAAGNQRPTVIQSANGTTQVNIQTPTQAGVSMNHYQQFDVNQQGVILNNSRQNTNTQLGGYIQANPWLLGGEAKVIVNQVNSQNPSHLNGYVEVGGRKADVIIANQAGINVDGGGFINAGGITLSTGNPLLQNGQVTGFQIRDGVINITGQGLDASTTDYTQLLSRAASINAGIWAKDLKVVTGQNDVDASQQISAISPSASSTGTAQQFAIDTGSLGGMYAGKISLISTEKGIGINNAGQVFSSAGSIQISADGQLNNSGSVVAQDKANPNQATLDIQAKTLNNSGSLSSLAQQNIKTENLNNSGLITTSTELNIRNQNQVLNQGELNAGRIDLETTSLKNQRGQIIQTGLQDLAIAANTLSNTQNGLIGYSEVDTSTGTGSGTGQTDGIGTGGSSAPSTATGGGSTSSANSSISASFAQGKIKANSIENEAGKITANGGVDVTIQQALNNSATLNLNKLTATGDQLSNQGTLSATTLQTKVSNVDNRLGKIYSQDATIEAKQLINKSGVIQGQNRLNLNIKDQLDNRAGQITAIHSIEIHDGNQNSLTIDNTQAGKILSVGDIRLQSKKLLHTEQSELAANQNIALKQTDALTVDAKIQAGQDLTIDNQSDVVNNSALEAGRSLKLSAQNIKNSPQGQIQANQQVQLLARDKIENTGLVNSQGLTLLDAKNEIQNMGTGQIYGDHVALQTKHLLNAEQQTSEGVKAGTIAARQRLDIASEKIENREQALISSENQLVVGGRLNQDYLAEGLAQSLDNASARIQSGGDMYLGVDTLTNRNLHFSSSVKEIPGTRKQVTAYQGRGSSEILDESHITGRGSHETIYLDGKEYEDYTRYNYTQHETKDYVDSSAPAEIISGGTLSINGQNLTNDKSQILAAKGINILGSGVNNIDAEGEHRVIKEGASRYHYVGWNSLGTSKRSKWNSSRAYNPADIVTPIKLDVVKYDGAYQGGVNSTQIESVVRENIEDKTSTEIWSITPDLSLPNQSLFSINKDNNNQPLIETSDAFTNYKKWLGSDYMLQMLNTDSQNIYKRLGDGYYEQKLVNDQIAKLTGQVYLDGYSNYEDQFKSLMDSGISAAKDFNLRVGVALSEAQIARLTSDIVWLVIETVTLVDGEKVQVLVPKVYAVVQAGDLNGQGTLIAADNVNLKLSSDLTNQGTIAGRQLVNLEAKNINNVGGLIQGHEIFATSYEDINNIGGKIQANKTLVLNAGRDINNTTTTIKTENKSGLSEFSAENIGRVASLYVTDEGGQLLAQAKNDINLTASDLQSQGSIAIKAGEDLTLSTVNVNRRDLSSGGEDDYILSGSSRDVGTQIQAKGDISLHSGADTEIKAGNIRSDVGNVVVDAGKNIQISEGRATRENALRTHEDNNNVVSKTRKDSLIASAEDSSIASVISGYKVIVNAGENIGIQGGQIVSDELTQLQAKQNINIDAAENYQESHGFNQVKKSGFTASLSSGVASIGYGKSSSDVQNQSQSTSLTQSLISSIDGNTNIIAGGDVNSTASIIEAGGDINLIGNNVNLKAAEVSQDQATQVKSQQSGFSVGVTYNPLEAAKDAYDKSNQDQFSDSAVGKIMSHAEAVRKASMAAATPIVVGINNQKISQKTSSHSTEAVVSEVKAGGDLNIIARDSDILSEGAKISAEGDALLHAKNNIQLLSVSDTQGQDVDNKRSGFSLDNRDHIAPIGVYNDKALADGDVVTSRGSQVSVGGQATLQTEQGDINVIGSKVVSQDDLVINAEKDVNIQSIQNSQNQSESQSSKGWGSAQISDTERFDGYMASRSDSQSSSILQERSQVGSLDGNVTIQAGNNYKQQVADVVAGQDINVTAKTINILEDHDVGQSSQSSEDLKIGVFSRVSSPLLDLVNAVDQAVNSKANDRTQALQYAAAGAQSYQTYSDIQGGALFKAEAGIGFSSSESEQSSSYANSQANLLKAGGNVNLTSTEGNIHLQNTQVKAAENIALDSAKDILLESGQSQEKADGSNSNMGVQVGYGASIGAQTGVYIYAEAGYGEGSNHAASNTHQQTTLESNSLSLKSQGDTTLNGAQATANRIDADVGGKLSIISPQDTSTQEIDQSSVGGRVQASIGTAWQVSGNYNNSQASGNSQGVNQQSGLFAGDGGYHVKADSVDLQGGAIVSTASKENNDLTAHSLTFSDIKNKSSYEATTVAISGGYGSTNLENPDGNRPNYTNNENWRDSNTYTPSLPQQTKDSDSTTTYATLSAGNITIGGKETTVEELGINSDSSKAHQQVNGLPNLQEVLDQQKIVANATSTIAAATATYAQNQQQKAAEAKQAAEAQAIQDLEAKGGADWEAYQNGDYATQQKILNRSEAYKTASDLAQSWGIGGSSSRALTAVTTAITAALGGQTDLHALTNTLSPYAAAFIGEQWGHGEDKNTAAQMVAHAILGATLAYVNGGSSGAGASAAVASEAAAEYLTNQYRDNPLYQDASGVFQANLLPEDVKAQIRDLTAGIGAVIGGAVGDSTYNAQLAGVIGKNAVDNNEMSLPFPINQKWGEGAQSLAQNVYDKNYSNEKLQEIFSSYAKGNLPEGQDYAGSWVIGSSAIGLAFVGPTALWSVLGGGVLGGGTGALTYINTTPKNEIDYSKLGIYTIGGAVTGALTTTTKNPAWVLGLGTMGSYSTQYTAEGKANVSSAIVSGTFGIIGNKLGNSGCGTICQTIIVYPTQTTATTLIDKSIEKLNKKVGKK